MFGLSELKKTRVYPEGREEGCEEAIAGRNSRSLCALVSGGSGDRRASV